MSNHPVPNRTPAMGVTSDHELIRNTIAGVAITFDTKKFEDLCTFFTEDCAADYTGSLGLMKGPNAVIQGLKNAIGHINTFHGLTTQTIQLTGEDTAEATTYCAAGHFLGEKSFLAEAKYCDKLVRITDEDGVKWKISYRLTTMMGVPRGDVSMFSIDLNDWAETLKA
ncbi:hypothetical protein N7495_007012 [Penicillium taxi]|uniref:uncharacterized protein n=1 Tax=Penicillium taxi TaxID=168475 RepID=UPI002545BBCD|nr:uncharacterized protein N7495_007012 [Penicillium taxi]KAJ5895321.1 hypothetical protein N7495_007012 [Penicillium taxi]